jgi:hypothetical protein
MAGQFNGLQTKIKTIAPQALFTHCYPHVLNLVLSKSCNSIKEARIFFTNLTGLSAFFSQSTKRSDVLNQIMGCRIPSNSQTRWNFTSRAVFTVSTNKDVLIEVIEHIINRDDFKNNQQTIREATGLKNILTNQNFNFCLHTFKLIFQQTDVVFSILQNKFSDMTYAKNRLNSLLNKLPEFRNKESYFR